MLESSLFVPLARTALLLGPVLIAMLLLVVVRSTPREATAAMLGALWQLPALYKGEAIRRSRITTRISATV